MKVSRECQHPRINNLKGLVEEKAKVVPVSGRGGHQGQNSKRTQSSKDSVLTRQSSIGPVTGPGSQWDPPWWNQIPCLQRLAALVEKAPQHPLRQYFWGGPLSRWGGTRGIPAKFQVLVEEQDYSTMQRRAQLVLGWVTCWEYRCNRLKCPLGTNVQGTIAPWAHMTVGHLHQGWNVLCEQGWACPPL